MTSVLEEDSRPAVGARRDAMVLAVDAGSHGPRAVEALLEGLTAALGADAAPTFTSTHVVDGDGIRHVGALVWEEPPWQLDLLAVARRVVSPAGATLCRLTRHGARLSGDGATTAVLVAAQEAVSGSRGRVVSFPGQATVTGTVPVARLVASTAVDAAVGLAGTPVLDADVVDTGGWLRPRWNGGRLELLVERAAGGLLRPFEQRAQIPCCATH